MSHTHSSTPYLCPRDPRILRVCRVLPKVHRWLRLESDSTNGITKEGCRI